jgi:RNA polymerase sigma-70 factor (ECF subfamily)
VTIGALPQTEVSAETFGSIAERCLDDVFGYLLYLTKDRPLAEDLTGETFETALRRWRRFDPRRGTARAWLLAIARSTALDWFRADARRRRREQRAGVAELPPADDHELGEGFSPALEAALRSLTAGEREVVALRVVLELDGDETARVLGISPTAVSTRLHRALAKLEERMRHDDVA